MGLSINLAHADNNPGMDGGHGDQAFARVRAHEAWTAAGGPQDVFADWWDYATGRMSFDSLKALVGLAWQRGAAVGRRPMADAEFHAWWDSISDQNTLAAHHPELAKSKE